MSIMAFEDRVPCAECNRLRQAYIDAWMDRKNNDLLANPDALVRALKAENDHKAICQMQNSFLFQGLWPDAKVSESK